MWTSFWDMNSGGRQKEDHAHIYIEADSEEEAVVIFYNRFGHNPNRVSCTCCGEDYSIDSHEDLAQLTGFHRGCSTLETPKDPKTGRYKNDDPIIRQGRYLEKGEEPPKGYKLAEKYSFVKKYKTLEEYEKSEDILVIRADEISDNERKGDVPSQGYVWVD
jgi:hypothetical protein